MKKKGLSAIAINSDTLAAAELERPRRNLWAEAETGQHQIVLFGPETMHSRQYNSLIVNPATRRRIAHFCVDEAHLGDEWGVDFRTSYKITTTMRVRLPEWTTYLALTASAEAGRQMDSIIHMIGFRRGLFHLEKRDCERHNVSIIIREVKYTCSGYEFRDLDWLIPPDMTKASDLAKTILYCEAIELGHRIVIYLRKLLPAHLQKHAHTLIRHIHSLNCPECKSEALVSLYKSGDHRECALFISTAVLEVGFDLPDLEVVVMFATPSTISGLVQRAGRPARSQGMTGKAIIYIKKKDIQETTEYLESDEVLDPRLLVATQNRVALDGELERVGEPVADTGNKADGPDRELAETVDSTGSAVIVNKNAKKSKKSKSTALQVALAAPGKRHCMAVRLVIAAHIRKVCITRQLNIIYDNPGVLEDCGRCSSCNPDLLPEPRPLPPVASPEALQLPDKTPSYMKLTGNDIEYVTKELEKAARALWTSERHPDALLLSSRCFFSPATIKKVTHNFHLVISKDTLNTRLTGWRYWDYAGSSIWAIVEVLTIKMKAKLEERHTATLEKQRAQRVHKSLVAAGLENVKRVFLRLPPDSLSLTKTLVEALPMAPLNHSVDPDRFYSGSVIPQKHSLALDSNSNLNVEHVAKKPRQKINATVRILLYLPSESYHIFKL